MKLTGSKIKFYVNGVELRQMHSCTKIQWGVINLLGKLGLKSCKDFAYYNTNLESDPIIVLNDPIKTP